MRVLSLFSGVGGLCSLGLGAAGHDVVGLCEIDDKARSVLRRHHPTTPIWEDVTNVRVCACDLEGERGLREPGLPAGSPGVLGRQPDERPTNDVDLAASFKCPQCEGCIRGRVDLVAGGSPCQDLSVAGRRAGLDGGRSGLFWHQCRIADELAAPWIFWENVAGAFSSNNGADFAAVLWGITGTLPDVPDGGWKSCGVVVGPKRSAVWRLLDAQWFGVAQRRRRVFVVGGPRGLCGPEVLALAESVSGYPRPSRTPGSGVAALTSNGVGTCGADDNQAQAGHLIRWVGGAQQDEIVTPDGYVGALAHSSNHHGGHHEPKVVLPAVAFSENQRGEVIEHDIAHSLKVGGGKPGQGYPAVAFTIRGRDGEAEIELGEPEVYNSLRVGDGGSSRQNGLLTPDLSVRRLTPRECERLMGWPDDHTRYADDGTEIADSHRYRMCGNGVVAPVARWIGERLMEVAA